MSAHASLGRTSAGACKNAPLYLADLMHRGRAASTRARRLSAIAVFTSRRRFFAELADRARGRAQCPRGVRRRVGVAQDPKTAVVDDDLRQTIGAIDLGSRVGLRDRALLLRFRGHLAARRTRRARGPRSAL